MSHYSEAQRQKELEHLKWCEEQMDMRNRIHSDFEGLQAASQGPHGEPLRKHRQERTALVALEILKMVDVETVEVLRGGGIIVDVAGKIVTALDQFEEREKLRRNIEKDTL